MRWCVATVVGLMGLAIMASSADARCSTFHASTMFDVKGVPAEAAWRTDYPSTPGNVEAPWLKHSFDLQPVEYMDAVLSTVRPYFRRSGLSLVGTGAEPWWMSEWMDYYKAGREPLLGLTKERGPDPGDLSPTSQQGSQVWAVNFYNQPGAVTLGEVFADPCSPTYPSTLLFEQGTVAIKFLFTDANLDKFSSQLSYLDGAPVYEAWIDPVGVYFQAPTEKRTRRKLNLIQLDISVKDERAAKTGWVFGTFVWMGPETGDGLYDNLVPATLIWANDEGVVSEKIQESWTNPDLVAGGQLFGWKERPYLGFFGRGNGPADNIRSSCLSCHAAARIPRSALGFGTVAKPEEFALEDFKDPVKVAKHVDVWFRNIPPGGIFDENGKIPAVSALDYSLQLESASRRMCLACKDGALPGKTPSICRDAKLFDQPTCGMPVGPTALDPEAGGLSEPLPRQ